MGSPVLPLSNVIQVNVTLQPSAPAQPSFNQGLITTTSTWIPGAGGVRPRVRGPYTSTAGMIADGATAGSPEVLAAQSYFNQDFNGPAPEFVFIGRQDLTAIVGIALHTDGTEWAVGDQFTIAGGGVLATGVILAETGGIPSSIGLLDYSSGTGYTAATNVACTALAPSSGTGMTVNTTVGESCLIAAQVCRERNSQWYGLMCTGSVTADHEAIVGWEQSALFPTYYFFETPDAAVLNGTPGNVFLTLQAASYARWFGVYSSTQSGAAPNNIYAGAAAMGVAMGLNTGLANSNFTMAFKTLVGITPEPLTQAQYSSILASGGNVFVTLGNAFNVIQGQLPNAGTPWQLTAGIDMLTSDLQYSGVNALIDNGDIPQNDSGENVLIHAVNGAAGRAAIRGFVAGGQWTGATIAPGGPSALTSGTNLPNGYLALSAPFYLQSLTAKAAGQAMPVYLAIITSGTVLSLIIQVNVQQGG